MPYKRLRVLIVLPTAILGGAERVMFNLADYLLGQGHYVTIYAMSRGEQPGWGTLKSHERFNLIARQFPSEKRSLLSFIGSIWKLCRANRFHYVISTHTHINAALSFLRRFRVISCGFLVARESTFIFERFFGPRRILFFAFYKYFYGKHDLLICQTKRMMGSLVAHLGFIPASAIKSIPNPVSLDHVRRMLVRSQYGSGVDEQLVVACGRLIPIKGFNLLIKAFGSVASRHPNARLMIIGDGPTRPELEAQIADEGLSDRIVLAGRLENPLPWFASAAVGVISSEKEGFPNVLIEMMAAGAKQIITTPCSDGVFDIPEIRVLGKFDATEMAKALDSALANPVDRSHEFGAYIHEHRTVDAFWRDVQAGLGA